MAKVEHLDARPAGHIVVPPTQAVADEDPDLAARSGALARRILTSGLETFTAPERHEDGLVTLGKYRSGGNRCRQSGSSLGSSD